MPARASLPDFAASRPEDKRKTIGRLFVEVFDEEAETLGKVDFLAARHALSRRDRERVVLRRTVGDHRVAPQCRRAARAHAAEADRAVARAAQGRGEGARPRASPPPAFVNRHPFPGLGLAIRVPGEVTEENLAILRRANAIYLDEIRKAGLYDTIWQAFAVLAPGPHHQRDGRRAAPTTMFARCAPSPRPTA